MNFYNPYLPFTLAQPSDLQAAQPTIHLNALLTAQLMMFASSNSLNGKRQFTYQSDDDLIILTAAQKKIKPSGEAPIANMLRNDFLDRRNSNTKQFNNEAQMKYQEMVILDEDCLIIEKPLPKASKDWNFEQNFNLSSSFNSLLFPINQGRLFSENQKRNELFVKKSEIIVIDNDDEDQLTCQSTPQMKQDTLSSCSENTAIQKSQGSETTLEPTEKNTDDASIQPNIMQFATIPSFELSALNKKQIKPRKVKSVWKPNDFEPVIFQKWVEQIEKVVGMEITNEEKVLKIIKSFDMNLEVTLEKIKRNKAHYKDHFRVKKFSKNHTPLL